MCMSYCCRKFHCDHGIWFSKRRLNSYFCYNLRRVILQSVLLQLGDRQLDGYRLHTYLDTEVGFRIWVKSNWAGCQMIIQHTILSKKKVTCISDREEWVYFKSNIFNKQKKHTRKHLSGNASTRVSRKHPINYAWYKQIVGPGGTNISVEGKSPWYLSS